jgi:uncharacterized protein YdeI (YjbR/CyaY-like superfamily)
MKPTYFRTPAEFRKWLATNHARKQELLVGFYKKDSGKPSLTWPESVNEALCYGWIDGIRKNAGADSYTIRFTPRRHGSFWSNRNIANVKRLIKEKRMRPTGLKAYEERKGERSGAYAFEQSQIADFDAALLKRFKANNEAWTFYNDQPPGYKRTMRHWVVSAKKEETRFKRLDRLVAVSANRGRVDLEFPFGKKAK